MQYTIEKIKLEKTHPLWGGETFYKIRNIYTGQLGLGNYTSIDAAQSVINKKNQKEEK